MEIKLTKNQYGNLMRLVYLGNWLVNAFRMEHEIIKKYNDIEQYIFSFAKEAGLNKYIEYIEKYGKFFPTRELEEDEEIMELIDEYENEIFWDELINRLALRDLINKYGEDTIEKMSFEDRIKKKSPFIDKYEREFEENGIKNFMIK